MGVENIKKAEKENKRRVIISAAKIMVLLLIVIGIPLYIWFFHGDWIKSFENIDDVVAFLEKYETQSIFVYIGLQIVQIIISVIPGQVFQMAAGYIYGFWPALLFAMTGAVAGTAISFMLAKVLGRDFLHIFFGEERMTYYIERLNSKKMYAIVFFLYLIPGIPKDMVSYAAGVSEIKFKPFLIISSLGRLPGMIGCLLMGYMIMEENYAGAIVIGFFAVVAFFVCIALRKKIQVLLDRFYEKITR